MIERETERACASELAFEAWLADELDAQDAAQIAEHVASCTRCEARRDEHAAARVRLLEVAPSFEALHARVQGGAAKRRRWMRGVNVAFATLALCAVALVVVRTREPDVAPTTRSKGAPHLGLYVKRGERVTRAESGVEVQANDVLRFTYSSGEATHLALFDVDARGVHAFFPTRGTSAPPLSAGNDVALDFGVQLDDAAGSERVLGVFCPQAFDIAPLITALTKSGKLPEGMGCHVDEILLNRKATP